MSKPGIFATPCWYCPSCDYARLAGKVVAGADKPRCRTCLKPLKFTLRPDKIPGAIVTTRVLQKRVVFTVSLGRRLGFYTDSGTRRRQPRLGWPSRYR